MAKRAPNLFRESLHNQMNSNRKIMLKSVPNDERNEWGYPNDEWEFCGYDAKKGTSMWRKKTD